MKDLELVEKILIEKGRILTYSEISKYLKDYNNINQKISTLIDKGLLVQLKKGLYYVAKLGSLGHTSISNYLIANTIGNKSFVSFEGALKFHGMFDQGVKKYRSISQRQYLTKNLEKLSYEYIKVKDAQYFGFDLEKVDGGIARIATKERALLDLIEYKKSINNISLVLEKLKEHKSDLKFGLLYKYAKSYSQTTIKIVGLLLDILEIDSSKFEKLINKNSTSRMLKENDEFSNKWRLYYNSAIETQT